MASAAIGPMLAALATSLCLPVRLAPELPGPISSALISASTAIGEPVERDLGGERYIACRYHRQPAAVAVVGPYRRGDDAQGDLPMVASADEARVVESLRLMCEALQSAVDDYREVLELSNQIEVVGRAALAITSELDLTVVLRRIVDLARELAGAQYAALGVPGPDGVLVEFLTSGISEEVQTRIGDPPHGRGVLGILRSTTRPIRLRDLSEHPASVGFPPNHPPMRSFLGVPIISRGSQVGHLYLTEKRLAREFTDEDVRLVELLARHAGVAIENARLFAERDAQRRNFQDIIDQLPEAVLLAERDPDRIVLANTQASVLLGWEVEPPVPIEDFLGKNTRIAASGEPFENEATPLLRALWTGAVSSRVEVSLTRPDGSRITTLINAVPLRDTTGAVTAALVVFQDISQIKDAEQLKDDFLSLVSHELRTPLTTIQGNALMLLREYDALDADLQREMLNDISTESRRLSILIENMVQLANIRAGRWQMDVEPVLLRALIGEAVTGVQHLAPDREFRVSIEPGLTAAGDQGRLDQVIRNLLHNAVKYSPAEAPIEVGAHSRDESVEITIRDYGPGIQREDIPYVFDRFHRGRRDVAGGKPGMGLGLYLAHNLIDAHGGQIEIESPEGGGTLVRITLPTMEE